MALLIGITGGIGSGKSLVSKILQKHGYAVYDTDTEAKRIMQSDPKVTAGIISHFGPQAYNGPQLNNRWIASEVFGNKQKLDLLDSIVHPAVAADLRQWAAQQTAEYVFAESAILFQSGFNKLCNSTIAVIAPRQIRIERLKKSRAMTHQQIEERINNQMSDTKLAQLADYVIINDTTPEQLEHAIAEILNKIP